MGNGTWSSPMLVTWREGLRVGRSAAHRVKDLRMGWKSRRRLLVRSTRVACAKDT